jgi:ABC-type glutathione transport system ATPase component
MTAVLAIQDLHVAIGQGPTTANVLRGVSLEVQPGEVRGLVGESGAGKSMLGRAVLGLLPANARIDKGTIQFEGRDFLGMPEGERRSLLGRRIALIPQDPMTSLNPVKRVGAQISNVLQHHLALSRCQALERATELLAEVAIRDPQRVQGLYPHEISGGMRQRVLIAMAFACDPSLIIADEPTTALDVTVQRQVLQLVERLRQRHGAAILFVTHDLGVVAKLCRTMTVLHAGRVLEEGETAEVLARPRHPYTRALLAATPRADRPADALRPVPPALVESLWAEAGMTDDLVRTGLLSFAYPERASSLFRKPAMREVLKRVDLVVPRGSVMGIVGESGSGKTTLGRLLVRLLRPTSGGIQFDGIEIGHLGEAELRPLRARIQMIFQDPQSSLNPRLRIGVTLTRPLQVFGRLKGRRDQRDRAAALLDLVGLPSAFIDRYPHELSGGQRQRAGIARALALQPDLVVADEIVSGLDVSTQAHILLLLKDLQQRLGLTVVFISHDLSVIRVLCDHVAILQQGEVVETGPVARIFERPQHPYTRDLLAAIPLPDVEPGWLDDRSVTPHQQGSAA